MTYYRAIPTRKASFPPPIPPRNTPPKPPPLGPPPPVEPPPLPPPNYPPPSTSPPEGNSLPSNYYSTLAGKKRHRETEEMDEPWYSPPLLPASPRAMPETDTMDELWYSPLTPRAMPKKTHRETEEIDELWYLPPLPASPRARPLPLSQDEMLHGPPALAPALPKARPLPLSQDEVWYAHLTPESMKLKPGEQYPFPTEVWNFLGLVDNKICS